METNTTLLIVIIISSVTAYLEKRRMKKADGLLVRANALIEVLADRPIDLLTTRTGKRLLTASSLLNHVESKIGFIENEKKVDSGFDFSKPLKSFEQRFCDLEKGTVRLEQLK